MKVWAALDVPTAWLPKLIVAGRSVAVRDPPVPVSVTVTVGAFDGWLRVALLAPAVVGQNFIEIAHALPGVSVVPVEHVPVPPKLNSLAFVPVIDAPPNTTFTLPVLVMLVSWIAEQLAGTTTPKFSDVGLAVSTAEPPVTVSGSW